MYFLKVLFGRVITPSSFQFSAHVEVLKTLKMISQIATIITVAVALALDSMLTQYMKCIDKDRQAWFELFGVISPTEE